MRFGGFRNQLDAGDRHGTVSLWLNLGDETAVQLALPIPRHDIPSEFLKSRLSGRIGVVPLGQHQAIPEILKPEPVAETLRDFALSRTDAPRDSDHQRASSAMRSIVNARR